MALAVLLRGWSDRSRALWGPAYQLWGLLQSAVAGFSFFSFLCGFGFEIGLKGFLFLLLPVSADNSTSNISDELSAWWEKNTLTPNGLGFWKERSVGHFISLAGLHTLSCAHAHKQFPADSVLLPLLLLLCKHSSSFSLPPPQKKKKVRMSIRMWWIGKTDILIFTTP